MTGPSDHPAQPPTPCSACRGLPYPQGLAAVIDLAERRRTSRLTGRRMPVRCHPCPPFCCRVMPVPWRCLAPPTRPCSLCGGHAA